MDCIQDSDFNAQQSANAAQNCTSDQSDDAQGNIDELAEGMEPATDFLVGAHVDSFQSSLFLHDPEEHDASQSSTEGADVDGDHVHPLRGPGLDQQSDHQADHVGDDNSGDAAQLNLLLQECNGGLIQVDDGGDTGKQNSNEEEDADETAHSAHAVEDVGQSNEHQAGACHTQLRAGGSHGRDDDEHGNQSSQGVEESDVAGGGGDLNVLAQVGAVDNGAVAGNGQGEECLTESVPYI